MVPCLCALLQRKDKATYVRMWQYIGEAALALCIILDLSSVLIDLEAVERNAIQHHFQNVHIARCFF